MFHVLTFEFICMRCFVKLLLTLRRVEYALASDSNYREVLKAKSLIYIYIYECGISSMFWSGRHGPLGAITTDQYIDCDIADILRNGDHNAGEKAIYSNWNCRTLMLWVVTVHLTFFFPCSGGLLVGSCPSKRLISRSGNGVYRKGDGW